MKETTSGLHLCQTALCIQVLQLNFTKGHVFTWLSVWELYAQPASHLEVCNQHSTPTTLTVVWGQQKPGGQEHGLQTVGNV